MITRRRNFVGAAAGLWMTARPLAQPRDGARVWRIGVLGFNQPTPLSTGWSLFVDDLRQRGYVKGGNLIFEAGYFGSGPERVDALAAELVALRPDLIVITGGMVAALAARRATGTIPIVMADAADPVRVYGGRDSFPTRGLR